MTEPYSPMPRAKASAKPVSTAGRTAGRRDAAEGLRGGPRERPPASASRRVGDDRLYRADGEGEADEDQRHQHAEGREGDPDAEGLEQGADPAVAREESREGDAGDGGGQGEGEVDEGVYEAASGEGVAHQHPGGDEAEDGVDERRAEGGEEGEAEGGGGAGSGDEAPEVGP